jgi:hypothetical protein
MCSRSKDTSEVTVCLRAMRDDSFEDDASRATAAAAMTSSVRDKEEPLSVREIRTRAGSGRDAESMDEASTAADELLGVETLMERELDASDESGLRLMIAVMRRSTGGGEAR